MGTKVFLLHKKLYKLYFIFFVDKWQLANRYSAQPLVISFSRFQFELQNGVVQIIHVASPLDWLCAKYPTEETLHCSNQTVQKNS